MPPRLKPGVDMAAQASDDHDHDVREHFCRNEAIVDAKAGIVLAALDLERVD